MASWDAPTSFDDFVRERHVALLHFAHMLCGDVHLADDLVQDALERTGMAWRRVRAQDDPEGYVRRTILNGYLNRRRRLRREYLVAEPPVEPRDAVLWRLLSTLPRRQRAVIVLRFYLDLSEAQIAEQLDCSISTVKSNASRGMAKLRAALMPVRADGRRGGGR